MGLELRDYQSRIFQKVIGYLLNGVDNSVMIQSPTGSGKTIMGLAIVKYLEDTFGWTTNWVAMRRNLLTQVREVNDSHFGIRGLRMVSMFDKNPPKADVIVVDEAQHDAANSAAHIHSVTGASKILGLSATPFRTDRLKLSFNRVVNDAGIHRLIQEGWLSKFNHYSIEKFTPKSVADTYLEEPERWGKTIVYFHSLTQCYNFRDIMRSHGVRCEAISSQDSFQTRERILDSFDRGDFDVLVNVAILTEGFDCPTLRTVFIRDSSKLPTIQMAGRGLRIHESKTICNIVQSKKTPFPFTRHAKPTSAFVRQNNDWVLLSGSSDLINEAVCSAIRGASIGSVNIPMYILKRQKPNKNLNRFDESVILGGDFVLNERTPL